MKVLAHRVQSSNRHYQFTRPDGTPFLYLASGHLASYSPMAGPLSKGSSPPPNLVLNARSDVRRSVVTASYHVSRSLCIASQSSTATLPHSHPSVVPGARRCRCHFRFNDVSSWRYPTMDVAFRMFLLMKLGGRHIGRKHKMLAIIFIAALGQQKKLISGYTWSPTPTHPCGPLETPISQV
jgi:hypothetical protein